MRTASSPFGPFATRCLLLASGLLAAGIGAASFVAPHAFFAVYGIELGRSVNLANELRASAGVLFVAGLLITRAVFKTELVEHSLRIAAVVFLTYGLSRVASMAIDGFPDITVIVAATVELAIGLLTGIASMTYVEPSDVDRDSREH